MYESDTDRALRLLQWFEAFKANTREYDPAQPRHAMTVPEWMTAGDVYKQTAEGIIAAAERAMAVPDSGMDGG